MDTNNNAEKKENSTGVDTSIGNKSEGVSIIEQANTAAERLERAYRQQEEILKRQEEMYAKQILSGRANAGTVPEQPKELTPQEYAAKVLRGEVNPLVR